MATKSERIVPCIAIHPGSILKDELAERGISQKEFAAQIGMQKSHLSELINGKIKMTKEMADRIGAALNIPSKIFVNLQTNYDYDVEAIQQRDAEEGKAADVLSAYDEIFDVKTILKRGEINVISYVQQLAYLVEILLLPQPSLLKQEATGMFRKSASVGQDPRMLMTWKILAEAEARNHVPSSSFSAACMDHLTTDLRTVLHANHHTEESVQNVLEKYGIGFCIVPKVDKASVDGYSFIDNGKPFIVLTKRYDKIDNFAFSLMHEVGHIFLHHSKSADRTAHLSIADYDHESREEVEANRFAANALIPDTTWRQIPSVKVNPFSIQKKYSEWAVEHGFNKWIVLGRIAKETGMYKFKIDDSRKIL